MVKFCSMNSGVVFGAVAVAVSLSGGVASAQPDLGPLINTTCSYSQVVAALNAQAPDLAQQLSARPQVQAGLQQFLGLPVDQRQQRVQQALGAHPQWQGLIDQNAGTPQGREVAQVASTCQNY